MNMQLFESFRRVDVYAFALVMWETTRRCMTHEGVEEYALPYYEMVSFVIFYLDFILRSFGKLMVIIAWLWLITLNVFLTDLFKTRISKQKPILNYVFSF